jgi:hypothetical protein
MRRRNRTSSRALERGASAAAFEKLFARGTQAARAFISREG